MHEGAPHGDIGIGDGARARNAQEVVRPQGRGGDDASEAKDALFVAHEERHFERGCRLVIGLVGRQGAAQRRRPAAGFFA